MAKDKRWNHTQTCDYCATREIPPDFVYENGRSGCRHHRGGKTATKRGHGYVPLKLGKRAA